MEYIRIGVITNTHGLKGTLKVKSFTDFIEERYKTGNTLYILFKNEYIPVTVTKCKSSKGVELVDVKEFTHINEIEKFKGSDLLISKDDIHEIKEKDTFYYTDLIGLEVHNDDFVGIVKDVREYPQGEYLVLDTADKKNVLIPFLKQFVTKVDIDNKKIFISDLEGLL
jgi:16S rRNA processing protein RimM